MKRAQTRDFKSNDVPFLKFGQNMAACDFVKQFAARSTPALLVVKGPNGTGKTRLVSWALSNVMQRDPNAKVYFVRELLPEHLSQDYLEYRDSILVFGEGEPTLCHCSNSEIFIDWINSLLELNISVILEIDDDIGFFDRVHDPDSRFFIAKLQVPTPSECVEFAKHSFPHYVRREVDDDAWDFCKSLQNEISLSAICSALKKQFLRENQQMLRANEITQEFFHQTLLNCSADHAARKFLDQRGIGSEAIEIFKIGLAPDDWYVLPEYLEAKGVSLAEATNARILRTPMQMPSGKKYAATYRGHLLFPIHDTDGSVISFVARNFQEKSDYPKYLGPTDSQIFKKAESLYGLDLAKQRALDTDQIIIVPGILDVIALHMAGIKNVVSIYGTHFHQEQAEVTKALTENVVVIMDANQVGWNALFRCLKVFEVVGLKAKGAWLFKDKGPAEYLEKFGIERLQKRIRGAKDLAQLLNRLARRRPPLGVGFID